MAINRNILRQKAKKLYKEKSKGVEKKFRMPFAQFFKEFMKSLHSHSEEIMVPNADTEDFDFEDLVNVSEIDDNDVENSDKE